MLRCIPFMISFCFIVYELFLYSNIFIYCDYEEIKLIHNPVLHFYSQQNRLGMPEVTFKLLKLNLLDFNCRYVNPNTFFISTKIQAKTRLCLTNKNLLCCSAESHCTPSEEYNLSVVLRKEKLITLLCLCYILFLYGVLHFSP